MEKTAPIAVYTSGKGSSAAGLTASVIRDGSTVIPSFIIGQVSFLPLQNHKISYLPLLNEKYCAYSSRSCKNRRYPLLFGLLYFFIRDGGRVAFMEVNELIDLSFVETLAVPPTFY